MHTTQESAFHAEVSRIMSDGRFDRACKTVESLNRAGALWCVALFAVASDVEDIAIDLRALDPKIEELHEKVENAKTSADRDAADTEWCKRADEIEARVLGWVGIPKAQDMLERHRFLYEEFLETGRQMCLKWVLSDEPLVNIRKRGEQPLDRRL